MKHHQHNLPAIYRITCSIDGKVYIGQARRAHQRWTSHKYELDRGTHKNWPLQEAWALHGEEAFTWDIVVQPIGPHDPEAMTALEVAVLQNYGEHETYNLMVPVQAYLGASESTRAKLSAKRIEMWSEPEFRAKRLAALAELREDPEYQKVHRAAMAAFHASDEGKRIRRQGGAKASEKWAKDEALRAAQSERHAELWSDPEYREKQREARSASWDDPEKRQRRIDGLKGSWARLTPEEHAARVAKAQAHNSDPEFRARLSASIKAGWERRKANAAAGIVAPKKQRSRAQRAASRAQIDDIETWWTERLGPEED